MYTAGNAREFPGQLSCKRIKNRRRPGVGIGFLRFVGRNTSCLEASPILTELQVKNSKAREKPYMLRDDRGLYLRVDPSGRKYWILRYWENKREHQASLGPYPDIGLKDARLRRDEIQTARAKGHTPRRATSTERQTFAAVAQEWLEKRMQVKAASYRKGISLRLAKYILPAFGSWTLEEITPGDILRLCRRIEGEGYIETASRVKAVIGQVFRFAIASGYSDADPTISLAGALQVAREKHFPTLTDGAEIGLLVRAMLAYPYPLMRGAMLFSILTFARPGEVRRAEWREIRGDVWDIPAEKMKMKRRHLVPLSDRAREILTALGDLQGRQGYIFPSPRGNGRPMSENGVRIALRAIGYTKDQIVPHGFRAMASTVLHENGFTSQVIERQLAHVQANTVARAYNHAEYWEERVTMMQWWADWLWGQAGEDKSISSA